MGEKRVGGSSVMGRGRKMTNLRFADDILLTARTLPQIKKMLGDVADAAGKVGLELHPGKAKILQWNLLWHRC